MPSIIQDLGIVEEVVGDEEKYGCLKREIVGECL